MRTAHRIIGGGVRYLLQDLFTTPQVAPLTTPRTCEPGPGILTLVNLATGTAPSISGGKYLSPRPTGGQGYDKRGFIDAAGLVRYNGLACYAVVQSSTIDRFVPFAFSATSTLAASAIPAGLLFGATNALQLGVGSVVVGSSLSTNTDYQTLTIARGNGYLHLIRGGTQFPSWTLAYVDDIGSDTPLYPAQQNNNADVKLNHPLLVLQKTGPWARDFGKCFLYLPIVAMGTVYTGLADALTYDKWTPGAAETLSIYFRYTDANNTYRLDCSQAGGTIKLYRRAAGVDTELDPGKTQTWAAGTPVRIGIIHAGGEIRTFTRIQNGNIVAKHVVTGETFNLAATGVQVTGSAANADLEVWPRTFSGTNALNIT